MSKGGEKSTRDVLLENAPWRPPHWEHADATALKALSQGRASPEQQTRALAYIMRTLCGIDDWAYRPGAAEGERDTTLALGRQFVGHMISKLLKVDLSKVRRNQE
jgi:hypothetical protein